MLAESFRSGNMPHRTPDHIGAQAQMPDARQRRDEAVDEGSEAEPATRQQLPLLLADHFEIRQIHQVEEVGGGDVVDLRLLAAQVQRFGELQHRFPQMGVIGDDDPRRGRAQLMHQPQRAVDVLEHADGVGDHDIVERSLYCRQRRRILDIAQHEIQVGMERIWPCAMVSAPKSIPTP